MDIKNKNIIEEFDENQYIRLNKFLSDAGVCSRREADRIILEGRVLVNGEKAVTGMKILPEFEIIVDGKKIKREEELILLVFNKPVGIECTADKSNPLNIIDYIGYEKRIYPIGRLDKDSRGLILLTNTGALVNKIMKASNYHEKEYIVKLDKEYDDEFIRRMSSGIHLKEYRQRDIILDEVTRPCKVSRIDAKTFSIILTQGLNRQIRRMTKVAGYKVVDLKRVRIMNIELSDISEGEYREVTKEELLKLKSLLK